ncbi:MAG: hypothetical protein ACT4OZ_10430 [Gemmatimonadota bacterium]
MLALLTSAIAGAQESPRVIVACAGQIISEVVIRTERPSFRALSQRFPRLGEAAEGLHTATSEKTIRSFVLLREGQRCNAVRRAETERILLGLPFIQDATVLAYPDGPGQVRIEVVTVDDAAILGGAGVRNESPWLTKFSLGHANLLGKGVHTSAQWRQGFGYRDEVAARYTNYDLFGKPWQLDVRAGRRHFGHDWTTGVAFPFLGDIQRTAWRVEAGTVNDYVTFLRPDRRNSSLEVSRDFFDAGFMGRLGPPGQLYLVGAQLSAEGLTPGDVPVHIGPRGLEPDTSTGFAERYESYRSVRVNALLGFRMVRFQRVVGFDAVAAAQDLPVGLQVGTSLGSSLPGSRGIADSERYLGGSLFTATGTQAGYAALQVDVDARRAAGGGNWRDVLTSGRAALYLKPAVRHLVVADVTWGAGWSTRAPYQLALGDREGGLVGYAGSSLGGGRRIVGRIEERWRVGRLHEQASLALAGFLEGGAVGAGDVVYGSNSGFRQAIGASVLMAFPARSKRTWRLDFAQPVSRRDGAGFEVRISREDRTRMFWNVPSDFERSRERVLPQSVFRWP